VELESSRRNWKDRSLNARAVSWKVRDEIGKLGPSVGKFETKLESSGRQLESRTEVGKFKINLERINKIEG